MRKHTKDVALLAAVVYFSQGALGIAAVALPVYLRRMGWTVSEIASATSIVGLPWVVKIVYGILSDGYPIAGYRRKSYLILYALIASCGWLALVITPPTHHFIITSLLIANIGFAATDVITDGLVVEHSRGFTSHLYQSISWASRSIGAIASGYAGGWLAEHWPEKSIFTIAAALPLLTLAVSLHIHERKHHPSKALKGFKTSITQCFKTLWTPRMRWFLFFLFITQISSCFGIPFFFYMKENLAFKESFLGMLMSLGWVGAVLGSLVYARFLSKKPLTLILKWALILNIANILSTFLIRNQVSAFVFVLIGGIMACLTLLPIMAATAIFSRGSGIEGTLFAVLMSVYNLGQIFFGYLGGIVYPMTGIAPLIWVSAIAGAFTLLIIDRLQIHDSDSVNESQKA